MQKIHKVYYSNHYGTITHKGKDVSWVSDETIVFKGSLENCINFLKIQAIDATVKLIDIDDVTVQVTKHILSWGMSVEIVIDIDSNDVFEVYASSYSVYY